MPDVATAAAAALAAHAGPAYLAAVSLAMGLGAILRRVAIGPDASRPDRSTQVLLALLVVGAGLFGTLAFALTATGALDRFDGALASALSRDLLPTLLAAFATITHLGDEVVLIGVVVVVATLLVLRAEGRRLTAWLVACVGNGLLNPALKHVFERARPLHDAAYATTSVYSFPSGHSSGAVVVYGMLAWLLIARTPRAWHPAIVVGTCAVVFTIGCSRVLLRVHWASDVVAGFASGTTWLALCFLAIRWFERRPAAR